MKIEEEIVNYNIEEDKTSNDIEDLTEDTEGLETPVGNTSMFGIQDFFLIGKKTYNGKGGNVLVVGDDEKSIESKPASEFNTSLLGAYWITYRNIQEEGDGAQFHDYYMVEYGDYILAFIIFETDFDDGTENTECYVIRINTVTNTIDFDDNTYFNRYTTDYLLYLYEGKLYFNMTEEATGDRIHGIYDIVASTRDTVDGSWSTGDLQDNTAIEYNGKSLVAGYDYESVTSGYDVYIPYLSLTDPV